MYEQLIQSISSVLNGISNIKEVFAYPLDGTPSKYPAVVFFPDSMENRMDTTASNFKTYRFKMWVIVDLAGTNEQAVFTSILPKTIDAIMSAFDSAWSSGTISGSRIWHVIDSGFWSMSQEQKGKRAYGELTLTVRLSNPI
jgi:hypothetical protein